MDFNFIFPQFSLRQDNNYKGLNLRLFSKEISSVVPIKNKISKNYSMFLAANVFCGVVDKRIRILN